MIEILILWKTLENIHSVARTRGRSPTRYGLLLIAFWFGGQIAGVFLGLLLFGSEPGLRGVLLVYIVSLCCASAMAIISYVYAESLGPVRRVPHELPLAPVRRSRFKGAVVGGFSGVGMAAIALVLGYGKFLTKNDHLTVIVGSIAVGIAGALMGLLSGIPRHGSSGTLTCSRCNRVMNFQSDDRLCESCAVGKCKA